MDKIISILVTILKAQIIVIVLTIITFIIELITNLKLLIDSYTWKKSALNADAASTRDAGNYLIINFLVFCFDIYQGILEFSLINIILWIVIIFIFTKVFYHIHRKYQAVDPDKADDDYI